jgi:hypothetical protein
MRPRHTMNGLGAALVAVLAVSVCWVPAAQAVQTVSTSFGMPVHLQAAVTTFDCENAPGPQITFEGALSLSGIGVELIFRNQRQPGAPHERIEEIHTATGIAAGETIVIPKQPSHGGVGGNPWISVQLVDGNGKALSNEVLLGRCVQGAFTTSVDFLMSFHAQAVLDVLDCTNNPGPYITVSGSGSFFPGVKARFIFRNQRRPGAPHEADAIVDFMVIPPGFTLTFPKQPVLGGVGGNPWISVGFASGSGDAIGQEVLLGRCVQLLPGN